MTQDIKTLAVIAEDERARQAAPRRAGRSARRPHADASALVAWVKARGPVAGSIFLAHGEPEAAEGLKQRLIAAGLRADGIVVPELDQAFALEAGSAVSAARAGRRLPPQAASRLDWHNDRAAFNIALNAALQDAPDDSTRERLLAALRAALPYPSATPLDRLKVPS